MLDRATRARLLNVTGYAAWTAAMVWLLVRQGYTAFLAPNLWILLAGGAGLLVAFMVAVATRPQADSRGDLRMKWIVLLLPLAFLVLVPCGEAGSFSFDRRSTGGLGPGGQTLAIADMPTTAPDTVNISGAAAIDVTLVDLYKQFPQLAGRRVRFLGMVNPRKDLPAGSVLVFRFSITCCAADASPIAALVSGPNATRFRRDTWVWVEGVLGHEQVNGATLPAVRADKITRTHSPLRPYLD